MTSLKCWILIATPILLSACDDQSHDQPSKDLKVVIIRHAEKPADGDNLSCQGQNRALQLSQVLHQKFKLPDYLYVPSLDADKNTSHSRMFQTITPFAVKYNLTINSKYEDNDYEGVANNVFKKRGTVLMVWSHQSIPKLARALGLKDAPQWEDADFDSIWILTYQHHKPTLTLDQEGLNPSSNCDY
ncbi:hypothetical protein Meth11DRAFT_1606 [Methylophilaceae bacterium 11]|uniref:histidine phosphatase family protein n=1 Tax=Methylotenera sp. 1P/1 TaxID=1131551 RepID=UPI00036616EF|nr:histidine phosphatase family protein [Methylotenera sp. 1P/1]EUJ10778.1 hypothetical protein Meth11DRAFT_1606 [Methylophilaceae bacterium 11]